MEFIIGKYAYWFYFALMMVGLYAVIAKNNLAKKVVGMHIFQTSIILFFVATSMKEGATIPILIGDPGLRSHVVPGTIETINYVNPLPHVLMLTAIVVMVAIFGVALALLLMIFKQYKTIEEDEIIKIRKEEALSQNS
jgi:multicomponent Na+:H+ antiporter subunit C